MASAKFLEEVLSKDVDDSAVSAIVGSLQTQLDTSAPHAQGGQQGAHVNGGTAPPKHGTVANGDSIIGTGDDAKQMTNSDMKVVYSAGAPRAPLPNGTLGLGQPKPPTIVLKTPPVGPGVVTVPQPNNSFHGLQPGQQGALLLKTENGQYQLLRVGPAPTVAANATSQPGGQAVTFRMQTVPAQQTVASVATSPAQAGATTTVSANSQPVVQQTQPVQVQRPANDNTKEKCRKFLANLLELSSREPKSVERNVRTLIQELIDNKVEPEDFCDKLERLLNASPQPCLIGFLKKSLPLLRHSLATNEMSIDGIRPPPPNVALSVAGAAPTVQAVRPATAGQQQVRVVAPGATVVRPGQVLQHRLVAPLRAPGAQQQPRIVTAIRQATPTSNIISGSQPPALHPVYPSNQPRGPIIRPTNPPGSQIRPVAKPPVQNKAQARPNAPSTISRPTAKEKEKKSFSSSSAYAGDDDINDVAAMGGVNLAEETQRILGSTEFVGTQIRSCREEIMCSTASLGQRIRRIMQRHGLDEPSSDVSACVSHAAQERLKNLIQKLAVIAEHRLEMVKSDSRYEVTNDVKGQLKFLEDLDKAEHKKHEEMECEILLRVAKSLDEPSSDVSACVSHAAQERLKNLIQKLAVIAEHRLEMVKSDSRYEVTNDVKGQLKFLEDLDKAERKKHEEMEREILLRAAKSRSKTEDPEQAKLKAKAKEMQRVEMEELRQREANATALQAIGPRKRPKLDGEAASTAQASPGGSNAASRGQMPLRQRTKKVTLRDVQFLFETEKDLCKSKLLFKSYLK